MQARCSVHIRHLGLWGKRLHTAQKPVYDCFINTVRRLYSLLAQMH